MTFKILRIVAIAWSAALVLSACGQKGFDGTFVYTGLVYQGVFEFHKDGRVLYIYQGATEEDTPEGEVRTEIDTAKGTFTVAGDTATFHIDSMRELNEMNGKKAVVVDDELRFLNYSLCPCPRGPIPKWH